MSSNNMYKKEKDELKEECPPIASYNPILHEVIRWREAMIRQTIRAGAKKTVECFPTYPNEYDETHPYEYDETLGTKNQIPKLKVSYVMPRFPMEATTGYRRLVNYDISSVYRCIMHEFDLQATYNWNTKLQLQISSSQLARTIVNAVKRKTVSSIAGNGQGKLDLGIHERQSPWSEDDQQAPADMHTHSEELEGNVFGNMMSDTKSIATCTLDLVSAKLLIHTLSWWFFLYGTSRFVMKLFALDILFWWIMQVPLMIVLGYAPFWTLITNLGKTSRHHVLNLYETSIMPTFATVVRPRIQIGTRIAAVQGSKVIAFGTALLKQFGGNPISRRKIADLIGRRFPTTEARFAEGQHCHQRSGFAIGEMEIRNFKIGRFEIPGLALVKRLLTGTVTGSAGYVGRDHMFGIETYTGYVGAMQTPETGRIGSLLYSDNSMVGVAAEWASFIRYMHCRLQLLQCCLQWIWQPRYGTYANIKDSDIRAIRERHREFDPTNARREEEDIRNGVVSFRVLPSLPQPNRGLLGGSNNASKNNAGIPAFHSDHLLTTRMQADIVNEEMALKKRWNKKHDVDLKVKFGSIKTKRDEKDGNGDQKDQDGDKNDQNGEPLGGGKGAKLPGDDIKDGRDVTLFEDGANDVKLFPVPITMRSVAALVSQKSSFRAPSCKFGDDFGYVERIAKQMIAMQCCFPERILNKYIRVSSNATIDVKKLREILLACDVQATSDTPFETTKVTSRTSSILSGSDKNNGKGGGDGITSYMPSKTKVADAGSARSRRTAAQGGNSNRFKSVQQMQGEMDAGSDLLLDPVNADDLPIRSFSPAESPKKGRLSLRGSHNRELEIANTIGTVHEGEHKRNDRYPSVMTAADLPKPGSYIDRKSRKSLDITPYQPPRSISSSNLSAYDAASFGSLGEGFASTKIVFAVNGNGYFVSMYGTVTSPTFENNESFRWENKMRLLAKLLNLPVFSPEFRRPPEVDIAVSTDDCLRAYKWLIGVNRFDAVQKLTDINYSFLANCNHSGGNSPVSNIPNNRVSVDASPGSAKFSSVHTSSRSAKFSSASGSAKFVHASPVSVMSELGANERMIFSMSSSTSDMGYYDSEYPTHQHSYDFKKDANGGFVSGNAISNGGFVSGNGGRGSGKNAPSSGQRSSYPATSGATSGAAIAQSFYIGSDSSSPGGSRSSQRTSNRSSNPMANRTSMRLSAALTQPGRLLNPETEVQNITPESYHDRRSEIRKSYGPNPCEEATMIQYGVKTDGEQTAANGHQQESATNGCPVEHDPDAPLPEAMLLGPAVPKPGDSAAQVTSYDQHPPIDAEKENLIMQQNARANAKVQQAANAKLPVPEEKFHTFPERSSMDEGRFPLDNSGFPSDSSGFPLDSSQDGCLSHSHDGQPHPGVYPDGRRGISLVAQINDVPVHPSKKNGAKRNDGKNHGPGTKTNETPSASKSNPASYVLHEFEEETEPALQQAKSKWIAKPTARKKSKSRMGGGTSLADPLAYWWQDEDIVPQSDWQSKKAQDQNVQDLMKGLGILPENIIMFGESFGGGLVLNILSNLVLQGERLPGKVILDSPWVGTSEVSSYAYTSSIPNPFEMQMKGNRLMTQTGAIFGPSKENFFMQGPKVLRNPTLNPQIIPPMTSSRVNAFRDHVDLHHSVVVTDMLRGCRETTSDPMVSPLYLPSGILRGFFIPRGGEFANSPAIGYQTGTKFLVTVGENELYRNEIINMAERLGKASETNTNATTPAVDLRIYSSAMHNFSSYYDNFSDEPTPQAWAKAVKNFCLSI